MAVKRKKVVARPARSRASVSAQTYQRILMYTVIAFMVVLAVAVIMLLQQYK